MSHIFLMLKQSFGDIPKVRDAVVTVGYPKGGEQISFTEGIVSRIGYRRYAHQGSISIFLIKLILL